MWILLNTFMAVMGWDDALIYFAIAATVTTGTMIVSRQQQKKDKKSAEKKQSALQRKSLDEALALSAQGVVMTKNQWDTQLKFDETDRLMQRLKTPRIIAQPAPVPQRSAIDEINWKIHQFLTGAK